MLGFIEPDLRPGASTAARMSRRCRRPSGGSSGARSSRSFRTRSRRSTRSIASTTCSRRRSSASAWPARRPRRAARSRRRCERVGLRPNETLGRFPHQLSGGQRQRIRWRARCCAGRGVIVADEPVSMVDASLRATILASLQVLNRDSGHLHHLHHPRPDDGLPDLRQHRRPVPGHRRRSRHGRAGDPDAEAPVHPAAGLVDSGRGSPAALGRGSRRPTQTPATTRRGRRRLSVRAALPVGDGRAARESPPPLSCPTPHRAAACFLYRDAPVLATVDVASIWEKGAA